VIVDGAPISPEDQRAVDVLKTKATYLLRIDLTPGSACVTRATDALEEAAAILRDAAENCYEIAVVSAQGDT
jgi:hypothetical protein